MSRILIIDDDPLVREATGIVLRSHGHDVTLVENGTAGIEAVHTGQFDLAIVDLFMPDMDGLHVMEAISRSHPGMPLIAASGFMFAGECPPMPNFEPMAAEAGAVATLYKPFRPDALMQAIAKALAPKAAA